jgi:succinate dehydrogenase / fumarate reductase cytochrome b subunit
MDGLERPLSPHLGIYRFQITATLSILHRATGVALTLGALVFAAWLVSVASGPEAYASAQQVFGAAWFKLALIAWSFCFFYHLANGVRHLVWDVGVGFEPGQIRAGGWAAVVVAVAATLIFSWLAII